MRIRYLLGTISSLALILFGITMAATPVNAPVAILFDRFDHSFSSAEFPLFCKVEIFERGGPGVITAGAGGRSANRRRILMMEERRRFVRDKVKAQVSLEHADLSGKAYDISERGIGLRIPSTMQKTIPNIEVLKLFTKNRKTDPCQVEAELKWNSRASNSTLVGFEIRSLQTDSCKDMFDFLTREHGSERKHIL